MPAPLRAARWSRVSSKPQSATDRNGLPFQLEAQDEGIEALGAEDTGIAWSATQSGRTVHPSGEFRDMLNQAGQSFDVLVVAMVDRLGRNAEEQLRAVRLIGEAGAYVYFAEEQLSTNRETSWEAIAAAIIGAEGARRIHVRRMKRTYAVRPVRLGLPAGPAPFGYDGHGTHWTLNEDQAPIVRAIFHEYVTENISLNKLAERHGLDPEHVKVIVRNPAYMGIAQHRGTYHPGKMPVIVEPELWEKVAAKREARRFITGGPAPRHPSPWVGRIFCGECGRRMHSDVPRGRVRHLKPLCKTWGRYQHRALEPIVAPLRETAKLIYGTRGLVVEEGQPSAPAQRPSTKLLRDALAKKVAHGKISPEAFLAGLARLDAEDAARAAETPAVTSDEAYTYWQAYSTADYDQMAASFFDRVEFRGPDHLALGINTEAQRHRVAALVPTSIVGLVGGEGLEPPTPSV